MHTWVVGATGTGKTQSVLLSALRNDILAGRAAIFIDGKGDRETLAAIAAFAREAGRERDLHCFDLRRPEQSHSYSPLLNGTANEQADKIMAALRWDNEFYRAQSKAALLRVLRALRAIGMPFSLEDVLAALSDLAALRALSENVADQGRHAELNQIASRWKDYLVETSGMRSQLESLLMTDFGELLKAPQPSLDLAQAYESGAIVYFALPVARFPETAPFVAKLVISDLNSVAGMIQDGQLARGFASVVIDEFAAFAIPLFIDLQNKGRSAGMAITISHQSMRGDLATAERGFADQVADNTNIKICLRQTADAEYLAGLSGTYKTTKRTEQTMAALVGHEQTGLGGPTLAGGRNDYGSEGFRGLGGGAISHRRQPESPEVDTVHGKIPSKSTFREVAAHPARWTVRPATEQIVAGSATRALLDTKTSPAREHSMALSARTRPSALRASASPREKAAAAASPPRTRPR